MIKIENLTKFYGKNRAVNHISFTINDNEILGFLGPNGAGKSTTMNMIAGYLPMTSGTVSINGHDISTQSTKAKMEIGYLPEIPPVYPDMKVSEYLSFCAGLKKIPRAKRKSEIKRVMELLKISDMENRLIKNLSKGYKQRVGFAQALLGNPKFLILDEPTVGLDPNQVIEVRSIIKDLKKEHSVIFSSHILSEVSEVCDRVVIINKGNIKAIDTIENLESTFKDRLVINAKIGGSLSKIESVFKTIKGVKSVIGTENEGGDTYSLRIQTSGDIDKIRGDIMSALVRNDLRLIEIFTEKPNLEDVFVKIINQPSKKNSLKDMLDELEEEEAEKASASKDDKKEEE